MSGVDGYLFLSPGKQLCEEERRAMQAALDSIVCHTPLNNLGFSRKGSALTFSVAFQALRTGLFEVGPVLGGTVRAS